MRISGKKLVLGLCVVLGVSVQAAQRFDRIPTASSVQSTPRSPLPSTEHARLTALKVAQTYARLPLAFEVNQGQTNPQVKFVARTAGQTILLTSTGAVLRLMQSAGRDTHEHFKESVLGITFVGTNSQADVAGQEPLRGRAHYFIGNDRGRWRTNVPTFGRVRYENLYPGIDVIYYGNQSRLEYDMIVHPDVDAGQIVMAFEGVDRLEVDDHGDLLVHTAAGAIRQQRPFIYQNENVGARQIAGKYVLKGENRVGFELGAYDRHRPLIIDPVVFYSTFVGGTGYDAGWDITVDAAGNAFVTGGTSSIDFPIMAGSYQTTYVGGVDAFVLKLNATGSGLFYSTYVGGTGNEVGQGIAIDASGNAHVTGNTGSNDFPVTAGAHDTTLGGPLDAWVAKLDASGSTLLYSTYLGGSDADFGGQDIVVDADGNAYITGETRSSDFPTTSAAYQTSLHGFQDATVTKLNALGSSLIYSTYLGGSDNHGGPEDGFGIALDAAGNAYVAGRTSSSDFPTTGLAYDTTYNGGILDAFATKLDPLGSTLLYSTYLGGSDNDQAYDIPLDAAGNAYLAGFTRSGDFPTSPSAFQTMNAGDFDAFATKLDPLGATVLYSTYVGGSNEDQAWGLAVDGAGHAHLTGYTRSTDFPISANAFQTVYGGGPMDAFVTKLNLTASGVLYSSYLGGASDDWGIGIALDTMPSPSAYVTGQTGSTDFAVTPGAFQTTYGGGPDDAFVAKILDVVLPPPVTVGKVTGGGSVTRAQGIGTFGFIVHRQETDASITGNLQYVRHASHETIRSTSFTSFAIAGNTATFGGGCTNNGVPCTFNVTVEDNGEPGKDDKFTITINVEPPEGGTVMSGNIQIHN